MIRFLSKVTLAVSLITGCGQTLASCIGFASNPGQTDPIKAELRWLTATSMAVFTGTVTAMEYVTPLDYVPAQRRFPEKEKVMVVRIATDLWWKGAESREVTLYTNTWMFTDGRSHFTGSNPNSYELGKKYLVYADGARDVLQADGCTRIKRIEAAAGDIELLNELKAE